MSPITASEPALCTPSTGSRAWWFLGTLAVLRNPEGAARTPAVIELTIPPGGSPPAHIHDTLDDSFLLLDGEIALRCGERVEVATSGSYVVLPHGVEHTFRVTSPTPARMLLIHGDDSFLRFIEAIGTPTDLRELPPAGTPTPAEDVIERESAAHGARFVGPSLTQEEALSILPSHGPQAARTGAVHHIALDVSDLRESEPWYVSAFGLVRVDGEVSDDGAGHVVLLSPTAGWLLTLHGPAKPRVEHIAFGCSSRDELLQWRDQLRDRGITPGDITDAPYGSGFVVRDPDGIEMELFAAPPA